jgi:hypothetical protein
MGSSGGVPSLGGGFFPSGMQFNPGSLPILDLMGWANSGGTQANPMSGGGIFGPPMRQQAPPPSAARPQQRRPTLYDISGNRTSGAGYASLGAIRGGSR